MTRLLKAWGALGRDQRVAALTSLGLFVSMLLPWYSKTSTVVVKGAASSTEQSLSAFQAFSFVEAAVLLVSVGVLAMLFARAEQRDFHLPGGDGTIVMLAGAWVAILIFYRLFDKPGLQGTDRIVSTVGVQWGIFLALLVALGLGYEGRRMRVGERGAPPLSRGAQRGRDIDRGGAAPASEPAETVVVPAAPSRTAGERRPRGERPRYPPPPSEQMSFEDAPPAED